MPINEINIVNCDLNAPYSRCNISRCKHRFVHFLMPARGVSDREWNGPSCLSVVRAGVGALHGGSSLLSCPMVYFSPKGEGLRQIR